ncbi:MAG: TonB-dependent receptor [Bacteroidales bacterium]|jgi:outer membrane cobalamin receptor|nr:TonB-dependent receptor [Bacteroidales bacterium]
MFCCKGKLFYYIFGTVILTGLNASVEAQDTVKVQVLKEVDVYGNRILNKHNSSTSIQVLDSSRLEKIPSVQLSDVIKHFSGVTVKDYGGIGGLKTVSIRSLGANHTMVAYDGLAVSDYQTGQINIGRFSLDNMDFISLNNGNENDIFHPARLFASASVLNFHTVKPVFTDKKTINLKASFCGGAFALLNPSLLLENKAGKHVSTSLHAEYIYNKGEYPFTVHNGDSISKEKRKNTDIQVFRMDANCFVHFSPKHFLSAKVFYYHSNQGLPGAVILYNTQSRQRMWDENVFTQVHYRYDISQKVSYQANGKMNYSYTRYLDPDYLNAEGKLDNTYRQREYYISNAVLYKPLKMLSLSLANDLSLNNLHVSMQDFSNPVRYSCLTALSAAYTDKRINLAVTVLHTLVADKVQTGEAGDSYSKFTPSASVSFKPLKKEEFYLRAFYKNIFRLPTFNDLYYRLVGNIHLLPENTHQINFGMTWMKYLHLNIPYFSVRADVYHNRIRDKIIAIPNKNLFIWSMINLGKVSITGMDIQTTLDVKAHKHITFELGVNYTFQQAIDMTDINSKTYKHQIPYTPKHSGSGIFAILTKWINCSYAVLYAGERYCLGQNIPSNYLEHYFDHSIAVFRLFKWENIQLTLRAECLNILNTQYEVVKSYPMTGRQFQGKIIFKW